MAQVHVQMKIRLLPQQSDCRWPSRPVTEQDIAALGSLLLAAYQHTVDYHGETLQEATAAVHNAIAGQYGTFLPQCSFLIAHEETILSACIAIWVKEWQAPLLMMCMTHPQYQRQGMATCLLKQSMNALYDQGYLELHLVVTQGNEPAERLFERLGFQAYS